MVKNRPRRDVESDSETDSSDEELREAFAAGRLKPGLNAVVEEKKVGQHVNNVEMLNKKLAEMKKPLPWIERLEIVTKPAPLAPELALQLQTMEDAQQRQQKGNKKLPQYKPGEDPVTNDFKRESIFYRQAQAAVLEGFQRLKALGIPTLRPPDYFAEMLKSDEHMHKVREHLASKQAATERSEKVRQLRQQRKVGKEMQIEATLKKHAEKKKMLDEVKKYRKGIKKDMDFLDNNKKKPVNKNRQNKDKQFGFGGKKKGSKRNTKASSMDTSDFKKPGKPKTGRPGQRARGSVKTKNRPGKARRQKNK